MINLGNIVGLIKSVLAPSKKYVLWGKILNPAFPNVVDILYWDALSGEWVSLSNPTTQYWLKPVISIRTTPTVAPSEGDRYLIADAGASGLFAGKEDQVVEYRGGDWQYTIPLDGYIITVRSEANKLYEYVGLYGTAGVWSINDFQVPFDASAYIPLTEKGNPSGVATLDSESFIPLSQIDVENLGFTTSVADWDGSVDTVFKALDNLRELIAALPDIDGLVVTVNGQSPDVNGNIDVETVTDGDITVTIDNPNIGYAQGDVIPQGTDLKTFITGLLTKLFTPTLTAPTFQLNKNVNTLQKIGATVSVGLTFIFSRGSILGDLVGGLWDSEELQDFRAGAATSYTIEGTNQGSNVLVDDYLIAQGANTFTATVTYAVGPQPLDSSGANFDSPLAGATSPQRTQNITGVYPLFAKTVNITTLTEQGLVDMFSVGEVELDLVAESGTDKQVIDIPDEWLSNNPISAIQFFNTVANTFDPTNKLSTFTTSAVTQTVEGNVVNYTRYTNNLPSRGALRIKLIF